MRPNGDDGESFSVTPPDAKSPNTHSPGTQQLANAMLIVEDKNIKLDYEDGWIQVTAFIFHTQSKIQMFLSWESHAKKKKKKKKKGIKKKDFSLPENHEVARSKLLLVILFLE